MIVNDIFELMDYFLQLVWRVQWLFWALAIALFFWGIVKFINNASDSAAHEDGKSFMTWGIIAFFVLTTIWAIVQFFVGSLGLNVIDQPNFVDKTGAPLN